MKIRLLFAAVAAIATAVAVLRHQRLPELPAPEAGSWTAIPAPEPIT